MKTELRKRLIRWGLLLGVPLLAMCVVLPVFMGQVGTYVLFGALLMLTATLVWSSVRAFRDEAVSARVLHVLIGGAMISVALMTFLSWTIASYVTGDPNMLVSPVVAGYIVVAFLGCVVLLTTPGINGKAPQSRLRIMWATIAVFLLIGLVVWRFGLERGLAPAPI